MKSHVGTSGWMYKHWRNGVFYPPKLPTTKWLAYYAERFQTTEINATFYRLPLASTCQGWHDKAPEGFIYTVKVSRFITHIKRLKDCAEPVATFLERVAPLGEHMGPLLYQLPPNFHRNDDVLDAFLETLPRDKCHVM